MRLLVNNSRGIMNALPGILLIVFFSGLVGFGFHLWKGGSFFRMIFLFFFALLGFAAGQWLGSVIASEFFVIGWVQAGFGITLSVVFTFLAVWLSKINIDAIK